MTANADPAEIAVEMLLPVKWSAHKPLRLTIIPVEDDKLGYHTNILRIQNPDSITHNGEVTSTLLYVD